VIASQKRDAVRIPRLQTQQQLKSLYTIVTPINKIALIVQPDEMNATEQTNKESANQSTRKRIINIEYFAP
jgi:hypothetical protein